MAALVKGHSQPKGTPTSYLGSPLSEPYQRTKAKSLEGQNTGWRRVGRGQMEISSLIGP